jgi:hypothetical protein
METKFDISNKARINTSRVIEMTVVNESRPLLSPEDANFCTFPQIVKSIIASLRLVQKCIAVLIATAGL